mmetsp:Transcript_14307/g.29320  ORF Transcript_14307/g.29320 Transcript_14307/m.29320 type:complete len:324 (-) Transcript_14307:22-993(-)
MWEGRALFCSLVCVSMTGSILFVVSPPTTWPDSGSVRSIFRWLWLSHGISVICLIALTTGCVVVFVSIMVTGVKLHRIMKGRAHYAAQLKAYAMDEVSTETCEKYNSDAQIGLDRNDSDVDELSDGGVSYPNISTANSISDSEESLDIFLGHEVVEIDDEEDLDCPLRVGDASAEPLFSWESHRPRRHARSSTRLKRMLTSLTMCRSKSSWEWAGGSATGWSGPHHGGPSPLSSLPTSPLLQAHRKLKRMLTLPIGTGSVSEQTGRSLPFSFDELASVCSDDSVPLSHTDHGSPLRPFHPPRNVISVFDRPDSFHLPDRSLVM